MERVNRPTNKGGARVKVNLYLPPWTKELPDHANISGKDMMEYNKVCRSTISKKLPAPTKTDSRLTPGRKAICFWNLGELRKILEIGEYR